MPFQADRWVIDVSGDGRRNDGLEMAAAHAAVTSSGIVVNGLPILGQEEGLENWYRREVVQGDGAFCIPAAGWSDFKRAFLAKLIAEIS